MYSEISTDVSEYFLNIFDKQTTMGTYGIRSKLVANEKQKELVHIEKTNDLNRYLLNAELIVVFNEQIFDLLDDRQREIKVLDTLYKYFFDAEKDKIKTIPAEVQTYYPILAKFGVEEYKQCDEVIAAAVDQLGLNEKKGKKEKKTE